MVEAFLVSVVSGDEKINDNEKEIANRINNFETNAIEVTVGHYAIFQRDRVYGAFRIIKEIEGQKGWHYEWVLGADDSGRFDAKTSIQGTGKVFESYKRLNNDSGGYTLIDQGGNLYIKIGPDIMFEWSYPLWVYLPNKESKIKTRMTVTNIRDVRLLRISDLED
jgi:archaellin